MRTTLFALLALALETACLSGDHCDPGMVYQGHVCVAVTPDASAGAPADADQGDGAGGACGAVEGFGERCTTAAQCRCGLDYCDTYMNTNRCTRTGCKQDPSRCPAGWTCMDLSVYMPSLPSFCIKQ